ncbi:MAG: O-antigen ligase family protein, partial [Clostridium sp.]|nr:O-antigen ligase family protein [Clostridium sp.]
MAKRTENTFHRNLFQGNVFHKKVFYGNFFDKEKAGRAWGNLFATAYLLLMFGVYPFYMKQGYVNIGEAKYRFFIYCSLAAAGILGVIGGFCCIQILRRRVKRREPYLIRWEKLSITDMFVILYATELFVSYVLSDYKKEALWGTEGWHIGLAALLVLCSLYFFISRFWDGKAYVWYVSMAASGAVFLLGILDRFSVYLIPLEIRQPAFISTLGNINWFCGYLSAVAPVGVCLFLYAGDGVNGDACACSLQSMHDSSEESAKFQLKWKRLLAGIYVIIAFTAGFCQGSSSIFLFFGALFYILLWIAVKKREWLQDYFLLVFLWGMSAQLVRVLRLWQPGRFNYDTDNLCGTLTDSNFTLFVGLAALVCFLLLNTKKFRQKETGKFVEKVVHRLMAGILAAGVFLWLALSLFYTRAGDLSLAQDNFLTQDSFLAQGSFPTQNSFFTQSSFFAQDSLFLFDKDWGNGRGAALQAGFEMYRKMTPVQKLFGVGPDCFSVYAYSLPEVAQELRSSFGNDRLTNAHNELLTSLVNIGAAGVVL